MKRTRKTLKATDSPAQIYRHAVACYTGGGIDRLRRNWDYLHLPKNSTAFYGAFTAVATTAFGGAALGVTLGNTLVQSLPLDSRGRMIAMSIATGGGFTIGMGIGIYGQMCIVERSAGFREWKEIQITAALKKVLRDRFLKDPIWASLPCSISRSPMLIPVRSPSDSLYEYETIMEYANPSTGLIQDPFETPAFHKDKLTADLEMSVVILKRLKFLMEKDIHLFENESDIRQLLLDEKEVLEKAIKIQYENARLKVEKRRQDEVITEDAYEQEIAEFKQRFGRGPKQDLDWSQNWPKILQGRWEKFHKKADKLSILEEVPAST